MFALLMLACAAAVPGEDTAATVGTTTDPPTLLASAPPEHLQLTCSNRGDVVVDVGVLPSVHPPPRVEAWQVTDRVTWLPLGGITEIDSDGMGTIDCTPGPGSLGVVDVWIWP